MWNFSKATKNTKFERLNLPNVSILSMKLWIKIKNIRASAIIYWFLWKRVWRISWVVAVSNKDSLSICWFNLLIPTTRTSWRQVEACPWFLCPNPKKEGLRKKPLYTIYGERTSIYGERHTIFGYFISIFGWSFRLKGDGHKCSKSFRDIVPPSSSEFIREYVFHKKQ